MEKDLVELVLCRQCNQNKPVSRSNPGWCDDCAKAYNSRYAYMRNHQGNWMEVAKDSGIELYERQPNETQLEWSIWQAYRDSYPGAKPSYKQVASLVGSTYEYVKKTAARWNFQVRMQAWIAECDRITAAQRRQEVLDMNAGYIDMAARLRAKLSEGINNIDVYNLKPSEIGSLMKTANELERKARLDTAALELQQSDGFVDHENPDLKKSPTKTEDLGEVLSILLNAGALGDGSQLGIRKTETTEIVVKSEGDI